MLKLRVSVNKEAMKIVDKMLSEEESLNIKSYKSKSGATVIDCGVEVVGGYRAGIYVSEVCLGGLATISLTLDTYDDLSLPSIVEFIDSPTIACMGSQYAGWKISYEKFSALGSGPARALALKPKKLFKKIEYQDYSDEAVLVLEANEYPPDEALVNVASACKVDPKNLYVIVAPINSIVGSIQVSCRVVEVGIHKLDVVGFDIKRILGGFGKCPIAPLHPDPMIMMGLTNDVLIYAGDVSITVSYENDEELASLVSKVPSSTSPSYGKPFYEIYKEAGFDFYKVDPRIFAPASITTYNKVSGRVHKGGRVNMKLLVKLLSESLGIS